jgi:hypothetical protein
MRIYRSKKSLKIYTPIAKKERTSCLAEIRLQQARRKAFDSFKSAAKEQAQ